MKLTDLPEEVTKDGVRIYGETSYENQMALLSHFLHNNWENTDLIQKKEIILAIREFLSRKESRQGLDNEDLSDEQIWKVAESPLQHDLFSDFFNVPFPAPKHPRCTFIDLFAGIGGFRIAL
jgi:DNA (cytosine-5)-methyltransferase 1